jgi:hypothetical protein
VPLSRPRKGCPSPDAPTLDPQPAASSVDWVLVAHVHRANWGCTVVFYLLHVLLDTGMERAAAVRRRVDLVSADFQSEGSNPSCHCIPLPVQSCNRAIVRENCLSYALCTDPLAAVLLEAHSDLLNHDRAATVLATRGHCTLVLFFFSSSLLLFFSSLLLCFPSLLSFSAFLLCFPSLLSFSSSFHDAMYYVVSTTKLECCLRQRGSGSVFPFLFPTLVLSPYLVHSFIFYIF